MLQKYLMFAGEMDNQWKTLKRKRMVNLKFTLLVLLKSFDVEVDDFFVKSEKKQKKNMWIS